MEKSHIEDDRRWSLTWKVADIDIVRVLTLWNKHVQRSARIQFESFASDNLVFIDVVKPDQPPSGTLK